MEWLIGFVLGFIADLFRSVAMPASTEWLNRWIPSARRRANVEDNKLTLEIMERLKSLGKDPDLAKHARDDADKFMLVLTSQQQAFVDNAIEVIDSTFMTQAEMNHEAGRRADVASKQMERAMVALERSGWMSEAQAGALRQTQKQWQEYAIAQATFAAAEYEGGSMAPLVYASELEHAAVSRAGELTRIFEDMRERYGE